MSMKKLLEAMDKNDVEQINETVLREDDYAMVADEMSEIKEQIKQLVYEAYEMIPREGTEAARARSYWFASILTSLDSESEFMSHDYSMQDTIDEINQQGAPYDQD